MPKSTLVNPVAGLFFRPDHVVAAEAVFPSAGGNTTPDPETVVLHMARQSKSQSRTGTARATCGCKPAPTLYHRRFRWRNPMRSGSGIFSMTP
jgi:hypothetical protein